MDGTWRVRVLDGRDRVLGHTQVDLAKVPMTALDLLTHPWD